MLNKSLIFIFILGSFNAFSQEKSGESSLVSSDSINPGYVNVHADYRLAEMTTTYKKENEGKPIAGYRIQLYSGNRQGALDLKKSFIQSLPDYSVTVVYESPDFKLQVGNFRNKLDAERAMQTIWPIYKSAFVVKTKIDLPKLTIDN